MVTTDLVDYFTPEEAHRYIELINQVSEYQAGMLTANSTQPADDITFDAIENNIDDYVELLEKAFTELDAITAAAANRYAAEFDGNTAKVFAKLDDEISSITREDIEEHFAKVRGIHTAAYKGSQTGGDNPYFATNFINATSFIRDSVTGLIKVLGIIGSDSDLRRANILITKRAMELFPLTPEELDAYVKLEKDVYHSNTLEDLYPILMPAKQEQLSLFDDSYFTIFQNSFINGLISLPSKSQKQDLSADLTFKYGDIQYILKGGNGIPVLAQKAILVGLGCLANKNTYRGDPKQVDPTAEFDLMEFAKRCGYDVVPHVCATQDEINAEQQRVDYAINNFVKELNRGLRAVYDIDLSGHGSETFAHFDGYRVLSSYVASRACPNVILNFDIAFARFAAATFVMPMVSKFLEIDNKDVNAFSIYYKLLTHYSNYKNYVKGINGTLSVKKIIEAASNIQTFEELAAKGRRTWKQQIKSVLENSLNNLRDKYHLIVRWEYSDAAHNVLTQAEVDKLGVTEYKKLYVNFILSDYPEEDRKAKLSKWQEKTAIAAAKKKAKADQEAKTDTGK